MEVHFDFTFAIFVWRLASLYQIYIAQLAPFFTLLRESVKNKPVMFDILANVFTLGPA